MKTIRYIYKDYPAWNCDRVLNDQDYAEEMRINKKYHPAANIEESETGATVRLNRRA